jgi:hypothetical protein
MFETKGDGFFALAGAISNTALTKTKMRREALVNSLKELS